MTAHAHESPVHAKRTVGTLRVVEPLPTIPQEGPTDRMADYLIDRLRSTVRGVFVLKIALNLAVGTESAFTHDVRPVWLCAGLFLAAGLMNVYVAVTLKPTRVASWALAFSIGGCLARSGAIIMSKLGGTLHTSWAHVSLAVTVWLALAAFGATATFAASSQLGSGRVRSR